MVGPSSSLLGVGDPAGRHRWAMGALLGVGGAASSSLGVGSLAGRWWGRRRRHLALAALLGVTWALLGPPSSLAALLGVGGAVTVLLGVGGPVGRGLGVVGAAVVVGDPFWRWWGRRRRHLALAALCGSGRC
jgi:hypothetical protein